MMPSKKKKYNARFPAGRIKKIMQTDEDVGKVAQAVPVIISRALELFVESLLNKAVEVTNARNARTLTPSHMKQCILSESRFDFLKDLVSNIPDVSTLEEEMGQSNANQVAANFYQSVKKEPKERTQRGRGRGRGGSRASHQSRNTSASSLPGASPWARRVTPPSTPISPVPPLFYREVSTEKGNTKVSETGMSERFIRPPVIQHTATGQSNHRMKSEDSGDEEEDEDEAEEENNGYNIENSLTKPLVIDEDYDT